MNTPNSQNKIECNVCKISPNGGICFEHRTSSHSQTTFVNSQSEPKSACCGAEKGCPPRGNPPQGHKSELCGKACSKCGKDFVPVDNYERHSHTHCWDQKQPPACNINIENHTQCCLCDLKVPASEKECVCGDPESKYTTHRKDGPCLAFQPPSETPDWMTEFDNIVKNTKYSEYMSGGRFCCGGDYCKGAHNEWIKSFMAEKIEEAVNKDRIQDIAMQMKYSYNRAAEIIRKSIERGREQGRQEEKARIVKMIEAIDDSGGGSGRRLKIQLLDQLKH